MARPTLLPRHLRRYRPRHLVAGARRFSTASDSPPGHTQQQQQRLDNYVRLVEVGARDGLQNEKGSISLATKLELIERLAKTGLTSIEAGAFVSPKWVPQVHSLPPRSLSPALLNCADATSNQMSNSSEILTHLLTRDTPSPSPLTFSFLVPNLTGLSTATSILRQHPTSFETASQRATPTSKKTRKPAIEVAVFAAATESFSQRNLNCSIATSLSRFNEVISAAREEADVRVRAYISVVLGCPFEGYDVNPHRVAELATDFLEMGADEIALGDTTGMGTAPRTKELLNCLRSAGIRNEDIAMHFHDTYGQALVNTAVALEHGIRTFDASVGGLGGCPYSPGATGNVATEDMVYFLESLGMDTGVDLDAVADIGAWITGEVGKPHESRVGKSVLATRLRKEQEASKADA